MGLILDSSVVIAAERRGDTVEQLIEGSSGGLGLVKLDFLLGTKWGFNARREQQPPRTSGRTSLSERRIKTLRISPYSSKTWREILSKVLILKDRPEGGYPPRYQSVNARRRK